MRRVAGGVHRFMGAGTLTTGKARLLLLACLAGHESAEAANTFQEALEVLGRGNEGRSQWSRVRS